MHVPQRPQDPKRPARVVRLSLGAEAGGTLRKLLPQWSRGGQTGIRSFFGQSKAPKRKAEECAVSEDGAAALRLGNGGRDGNGLSMAQRQRMEENRRIALRRRHARLSREAAAMQV